MKIVILKFGGTSLTTIEKRNRIISLIKQTIKKGETPIVVVSAIGRFTEPYATDTLISLVNGQANFIQENPQAMDLLMSCGETISAVVMASFCYKSGIPAYPITGGQAGIITNDNFGDATIERFNNKVIKRILAAGKVPIVGGFQGVTKDGLATTLGRGGSDTTATILGAYLHAERIEIYKDVDGIMTGDPKEDNNAILLSSLSYDEAIEIAKNGAKVIHAKAIPYAKEKKIPIYVKNLFGNKSGTIIK